MQAAQRGHSGKDKETWGTTLGTQGCRSWSPWGPPNTTTPVLSDKNGN